MGLSAAWFYKGQLCLHRNETSIVTSPHVYSAQLSWPNTVLSAVFCFCKLSSLNNFKKQLKSQLFRILFAQCDNSDVNCEVLLRLLVLLTASYKLSTLLLVCVCVCPVSSVRTVSNGACQHTSDGSCSYSLH